MISVLFIGDIVGRMGRKTIAKILPRIKKENNIDLVVANAENSAHGSGITENIIKELKKYGVDYFTTGDHTFSNRKQLDIFDSLPVIRPANYNKSAPGYGQALIKIKEYNILLINLIGRVFMPQAYDCPFHKLDEILANTGLPVQNLSAIIIDIHAETTSEKINLLHYADGRVSAILGTHTHVMTADASISRQGTAFISDVGMVGAADESLGIEKKGTLKTFLTGIKQPHVLPEKGRAIFSSVLIQIDPKNKKAHSIKPIIDFIKI